jgi:hypothetical protein
MGKVKQAAISYGWFLAFVLVTAVVVAPAVKKFNVPLLKDVL